MSKIKILVVEDEMIIADNICDTLEDLGYDVCEPAINYTEAIATINSENPDIAILDIQLSGRKTGIDIAKKIRESYHFPFIFLTSNADSLTLNQAKEVMPPAYLIKPFSKEELYTSLEIALSNFSKYKKEESEEVVESHIIKNAFFIKNQGSYIKILFNDILYLKSAHVYVELFLTNNKKFLIRKSLSDVLENLDTSFIRVHRSFVVNIKYISEIKNASVIILQNEIPIGKTHKKQLIEHINLI